MIPYQAAFKAVSLEQLTALDSRIEIVCAVVVSQVGAVVMILVGGIVIILLRRVVVSVVLLIVLAAVYQRPAHEFIKLHIIVKRINGCYWLKSLPLFLMHEFGAWSYLMFSILDSCASSCSFLIGWDSLVVGV